MKWRNILFVWMILLFFSCNDENETKSPRLLKVKIDPTYLDGDDWIFISDADGKTIDAKKVQDNTELEFFGNVSEPFSCTILFLINSNPSGDRFFSFSSIDGIEPDSEFSLKINSDIWKVPEVLGVAKIGINSNMYLGSPFYAINFSDGHIDNYNTIDDMSIALEGSGFSVNVKLRRSPNDLLISSYIDNQPVHQWLRNVKVGDDVVTNSNLFLPSKPITINIEGAKNYVSGHVSGIQNPNLPYLFYVLSDLTNWNNSLSSNLTENPKLGYIDGFAGYYINVFSERDKSDVSYHKSGLLVETINIPDYTFAILDNNPLSFSFNFSNDYTYKTAQFGYNSPNHYVNWSISASEQRKFVMPQIPVELLSLYPDLDIKSIKFSSLNFFKELDGYSYSDFVRDQYLNFTRSSRETLTYRFIQ